MHGFLTTASRSSRQVCSDAFRQYLGQSCVDHEAQIRIGNGETGACCHPNDVLAPLVLRAGDRHRRPTARSSVRNHDRDSVDTCPIHPCLGWRKRNDGTSSENNSPPFSIKPINPSQIGAICGASPFLSRRSFSATVSSMASTSHADLAIMLLQDPNHLLITEPAAPLALSGPEQTSNRIKSERHGHATLQSGNDQYGSPLPNASRYQDGHKIRYVSIS